MAKAKNVKEKTPVRGGQERKNKTGYKGIAEGSVNTFKASLHLNISGKTHTKYIGSFSTAKEAYKARCKYIDSLK